MMGKRERKLLRAFLPLALGGMAAMVAAGRPGSPS